MANPIDPHWTGITLTSFECFPRLLPELRCVVWKSLDSEPRLIELEPNPNNDQIITHHKTPAYLQACWESRHYGLKKYETLVPEFLVEGVQPTVARILIDFEVDTVLFKSEMFSSAALQLVSQGMPINYDKIRCMAIHLNGCLSQNAFNRDILNCSNLQTLYLAFDEADTLGLLRLERYRSLRLEDGTEVPYYHCMVYNRGCTNFLQETFDEITYCE